MVLFVRKELIRILSIDHRAGNALLEKHLISPKLPLFLRISDREMATKKSGSKETKIERRKQRKKQRKKQRQKQRTKERKKQSKKQRKGDEGKSPTSTSDWFDST